MQTAIMASPVSKILNLGEVAGLLIAAVAIIFRFLSLPYSSELFLVGLLVMAAVYFVTSFVTKPEKEETKSNGLATVLVPVLRKIMYIGISVLCVAYVFTFLHLSGANEMMIIGLLTLVICLLVSMILLLTNRSGITQLRGPLFRSIIALIFYFLTPLLN